MLFKPELLDLRQLHLQSYCDHDGSSTNYFHELRYCGDLVWLLGTSQSSSGEGRCISHIADDGTLRVRVSHMNQRRTMSSSNNSPRRHVSGSGSGSDDNNQSILSPLPEGSSLTPYGQQMTHERYTHDLFQLLTKSVEQFQLEVATIGRAENLVDYHPWIGNESWTWWESKHIYSFSICSFLMGHMG